MEYNLPYDKTNPISIEKYAQKLVGHTFNEIKSWNLPNIIQEEGFSYGDKARKGGLGNFIEEHFFCYQANSDSSADFSEAGVELKVSPYEIRKNGKLSAGERLVLTMISYEEAVEPEFKKSHLWQKCKLMLLIYYLRDRSLENNMDYRIDYAKLFSPIEKDLEIIIDDYNTIIDKVRNGRADELSESDTMYLGACTKGSTAIKSTVSQAYYAPDVKARKRAFCFKSSYMTYVLNNYITTNVELYEPIVKSADEIKHCSFSDYVVNRIESYRGESDRDLCKLFGREYNNNKAQWIELSYRMLGIKSSSAEEFKKANIVVKAIRIEENGNMKESSPMPTMKFKEIVAQDWEGSDLYEYFSETKFLFVVFKKSKDVYVLQGAQIWNMPAKDLDGEVRKGWESVKAILSKGLILNKKQTKTGIVVENNLPGKKSNEIIHIRPHSPKRFYLFEDGATLGDGDIKHADELPDGRFMTKQSFWINNSYIISQLKKELI